MIVTGCWPRKPHSLLVETWNGIFPAMTKHLRRIALTAVLVLCPIVYAQSTHSLKCGALFDSTNGSLRQNVIIEIQGNNIISVQPASNASAGASITDLSSETCLPGLIDTHTHVLL